MTQPIDYTIQKGDTLSEIAYDQGYRGEALQQAVAEWSRANDNIKNNGNLIFAGDTIQITKPGDDAAPAGQPMDDSQPMDYTIQEGDTLSEIAYDQGYRGKDLQQAVAEWARANDNIKNNGNLIFAGDTIQITSPGDASAPAEPPIDETRLAGPGSFENYMEGSNTATDSWMDIARNELGQNEIAGSRDNPRIVDYHGSTSLNASDDETPWCASFVNWVMEQAGIEGTDSAAAMSWADWGQSSELTPGAVVVVPLWVNE